MCGKSVDDCSNKKYMLTLKARQAKHKAISYFPKTVFILNENYQAIFILI